MDRRRSRGPVAGGRILAARPPGAAAGHGGRGNPRRRTGLLMELWVPITLAAAFMQNLRSALQKHLKGSLSTSGATFCRFV